MTALRAIMIERVEHLPALPAADLDRAAFYARQDKAPSTRTAYRADYTAIQAFRDNRGVASLSAAPETVAGFLAEAGRKPATIGRRCAAIRYAHQIADFEPPTNAEAVKATLRGIRRMMGTAPARKAPAIAEIARNMARAAPERLKGLRDRAMLLLGFGGAFRRSEIVTLTFADLEETEHGLRVSDSRGSVRTLSRKHLGRNTGEGVDSVNAVELQ